MKPEDVYKAPFKPNAFNLRMPPELKLAIMVAADKNHRSINEEIVHRLTQSLDGYTR